MHTMLKTETTWNEIKNRVATNDAHRVDYTGLEFGGLFVDPGLVTEEGKNPVPFMEFNTSQGETLSLPMNDRAYGHYLGKLSIPYGFARKFSPTLQNDMISERIAATDCLKDGVFLRTDTRNDGMVRGLLSARYGDARDRQVIEILDELYGKGGLEDFEVLRGYTNDAALTLTLVGRGGIGTWNGDKFFPTIQLRNSEVGASSFQIVTGICKGACSNGMLFGNQRQGVARIRHLGSELLETIKVAISQSVTGIETWREAAVPAIQAAEQIKIDTEDKKQVTKVIRDLRNRSLTKRFSMEAIEFAKEMPEETYGEEFPHSPKINRWTLVNAMTHLAQEGFDQFDRSGIEAAAGALLMSSLN